MTRETQSTIKRALAELRALRARAEAAEGALCAPIAVIGMALRLPGGVTDAASFADVLWGGVDTISEVPAARWALDEYYADDADAPGKMTTRFGGFIDNVDQFDAAFFGISPREAASMDPQQRLLLELAWEALEDAGVAPDALKGARSGVYVGLGNCDYGRAIFPNRDLIDPYFATGTSYSVAAGRIAYTLGLMGPAVTVDTACSSSLVALHLAVPGAAPARMRRRARRRRQPHPVAGNERQLHEGTHDVARRSLQDVRCRCRRLCPRRGRRRAGAQASRGRAQGRRPDARAHSRHRAQPGWTLKRDHRAQRAGTGSSDPRGDGKCRRGARPDRLRRGAWHGHAARRPDRDRRAAGGDRIQAVTATARCSWDR